MLLGSPRIDLNVPSEEEAHLGCDLGRCAAAPPEEVEEIGEPPGILAAAPLPLGTVVGEFGKHESGERILRETREVLAAQPSKLLRIEDCALPDHAVERELLDELPAGHDLLVSAGRPTEEREEVHHRLGEDPVPPMGGDRGGSVALGYPLPAGREDHRDVPVAGHVLPECA